jgi:hypothetical protein
VIAATTFSMPEKGTRVIDAASAADICWRQRIDGAARLERWNEWQRVFTASGRSFDSQL